MPNPDNASNQQSENFNNKILSWTEHNFSVT